MAPAHGNGEPGLMAPLTSSAPADPAAPGLVSCIRASEAPPNSVSVDTCQPSPNSEDGSAPSKSLIFPAITASARCASVDAGCRSSRTPPFQMATMFRVAVTSLVGSPSTSSRSARRPATMRPRSDRLKARAGAPVAAVSAAMGDSPARTSKASSR